MKLKKETQNYILVGLALLAIFMFYQGGQLQVAYMIEDCRDIPDECSVLYWDNQTPEAQLTWGKYACTVNCEEAPEPEEIHETVVVEKASEPDEMMSDEELYEEGLIEGTAGEWYKKATDFNYKTWYAENKVLSWILLILGFILLTSQIFKPRQPPRG